MNWSEFFAMGGYAVYVWSSYGITFVVLTWNIVAPWLERKSALKRIAGRARRQRREQ